MRRLQVYRALRKHVVLSEERSVMYETNVVAKVLIFLASAMVALYLVFIAVGLSLIANDIRGYTPCQFICGMMPFFLIIDAVVRTLVQRTPAQLVKPYLLLPLRRYECVDAFVISSIITPNNLLWLFLFIPYAIMSVVFSTGFFSALFLVVSLQLAFVCNSLFFMLCRTLVIQHIAWLILPLAVYGIVFLPWPILGFDAFFRFYSTLGTLIVEKPFVPLVAIIIFVVLMFLVNQKVQYTFVSAETMTDSDIKIRNISSFSVFDRFNRTGEYLKLELKGLLRNKNMRHTFIFSMGFIVIISILDSFTGLYDDSFAERFWSLYPFTLMSINLVRIMCPEGNYIECLLVRKENIRSLLEAKYDFYSISLLIPFILMLPTVITGTYPLLLLMGMMIFTAGPVYCMLMHLAIINKVTMPLNTKLTRKTGVETNYVQVIVEMVAMFLPIGLVSVLDAAIGSTPTYIFMIIVGLAFILTSKTWINMIYKRMMKRKYRNLEGFMSSR